MAKVRIQTRKKDAEEGGEDGTLPQPANGSAQRRQNEGAVEILARVLRSEGFLGWYKVCGGPAHFSEPDGLLMLRDILRAWALRS